MPYQPMLRKERNKSRRLTACFDWIGQNLTAVCDVTVVFQTYAKTDRLRDGHVFQVKTVGNCDGRITGISTAE